jgi:PAS domain S-box-containing protein
MATAKVTLVYLSGAALVVGLHFAVGGSSVTYELIGIASAAAVLAGVRLWRPAKRTAWLAIGASQAVFWIGDVIYQHQSSPSFPGIPDIAYLVGYALFIAGLGLLLGRDFPWRDWEGHIDAALITACIGFAAWLLLLGRSMHFNFDRAGIVSAGYPLLDLIAFAILVRIGLLPGLRPASYWLLLGSLGFLVVSDLSYVVPALGDTYQLGSWMDVGWLSSYALVGAAALHPSMVRVANPDPEVLHPAPLRGIVAGVTGLVLLRAADRYRGLVRHRPDSGVTVAAGIVLVTLVIVRLVLLVRELDLERRRAEESERKFRMVFERSPLGISIGRDGMMSETNEALQEMLGYSREEFEHMHYTDITSADEPGFRDTFAIDKKVHGKAGREVDAHVHVVLDARDGLGISMIEDVTERLELEAQLRQSQKMDAIGKLAGGIAHDFNNLMTAVLGYSDLLLARLTSADPNREKVEGIRDAALRASDLTRQLLAFGRRQMLEVKEVDLRDVVGRSESLLRRLIGEDVKLETALCDEPVVVRADPTQLDQVVMNLAVNAREAMPGGGTLAISVKREGNEAVLAVADTGVGIDEATRDRIFEPFFTTKPVGEGTGLGLSTVDGIVAQSGGAISVTSEPGEGTVFVIRLPLVEVPAAKLAVD